MKVCLQRSQPRVTKSCGLHERCESRLESATFIAVDLFLGYFAAVACLCAMELLEQMQMNLLARCDKKKVTFLRLPHEEMVPVSQCSKFKPAAS